MFIRFRKTALSAVKNKTHNPQLRVQISKFTVKNSKSYGCQDGDARDNRFNQVEEEIQSFTLHPPLHRMSHMPGRIERDGSAHDAS